MTKRIVSLLLVGGLVVACGLAVAQDPGGPDEPPVRLKKKGKTNAEEKPKTEPGKPVEEKKDKDPAEEKKEAEPQGEPVPEIDEHEVLHRVGKTMRSVEDRIAKHDLGEGTRQAQQDIVKDLDSLIERSQRPPQGGGGGGQNNEQQNQNQNKKDNEKNQGGGAQNGGQKQEKSGGTGKEGSPKQGGGGNKQGSDKQGGASKQGSQGQQTGAGREARRERRQANRGQQKGNAQQQAGGNKGGQPGSQPMGNGQQQANAGQGGSQSQKPGQGGNQPGGGSNQSPLGPNRNADLYKDEWGHLPPSLRAEMNAYSNPEPFLAKYDDLIRKYYRTIAEQGRKKGD